MKRVAEVAMSLKTAAARREPASLLPHSSR
jgi:hypothetical protein